VVADPVAADPVVAPVLVLLVADLLLDEHAPATTAIARAHAPYESFLLAIISFPPCADYLATSHASEQTITPWWALGVAMSNVAVPLLDVA
jgi:hypothetical protein